MGGSKIVVRFEQPDGTVVEVEHTPEEYKRFLEGTDPEACAGMEADLDTFITVEEAKEKIDEDNPL